VQLTPKGAGPNGAASLAVIGSGLAVPVSALQRTRYPLLQHFSARGKLEPGGKAMTGYEVRFGVQLGLSVGRAFEWQLSPGMPARAMAALMRQTAESLDALADDAEAETADPRNTPQPPPAGTVAAHTGFLPARLRLLVQAARRWLSRAR
jgi:hypothetical protein